MTFEKTISAALLSALVCVQAMAAKPAVETSLAISSTPASATATLDGNPCGITPLEINGIVPGKHLICVSKRGFHDSFVSVDAAPGVANSVEVSLDPVCAAVIMSSEPTDAGVSMDGVYLGVTPLLVPDVGMGKHRLSFGKQGFQDRVIEFNVVTPAPQRQNVTLVSDSAELTVESTPEASVTLNGVLRGTTPVVIGKIPPGTVELTVSADGYETVTQSIPLAAGDSQKVPFQLVPLPAALSVITVPSGVRIYIDDQYKGDSPLKLEGLKPGTYRVRTDSPVHDPMARSVTLGNAADVTEEFRLVPNCGFLRVVTAPAGVTVLVDGKSAGESKFDPEKSDSVSNPLVITNIAVGTRSIAFTKSGYFEEKRTVEIERDKETVLDVSLKRKFIPDYEVRTAAGVYRGVLVNITPEFVRIETEIGVTRAFPRKDIISSRMLRDDKKPLEQPKKVPQEP